MIMSGSEKQSGRQATITIPISGMHCAACAARVEKACSLLKEFYRQRSTR